MERYFTLSQDFVMHYPHRQTLIAMALAATAFLLGNGICAVRPADAAEPDRADSKEAWIRPYEKNPRYWQYQGRPVVLVGGSQDDNLFQIPNLKEHLDEIQKVGGNYIRNTMSARPDFGFEVQEFKRLPDGKYDLDQWNDEYWTRFHNLLKWCHERDIIIQIEIWDRFDYSRDHWQTSPWNPANNVNYTYEQTGFAKDYPAHPGQNRQPFFFTIPGMSMYSPKLDVVRDYQERRVAKMLSYSLRYPNVLYCMNNETSGSPEWGQHWMEFVRTHAAEQGVEVYATDMFDDVFRARESAKLRLAIDNPEIYPFLDISQNNSRNYDEDHWNNILWIAGELNATPRPMNNTKIYGSGYKSFGTGGPEDGVERFWRNLIGGCASSRFHRPDSGNGLNDFAKGSIQAARLLETKLKFWDVTPHMGLLSERDPNEAYLAARPGECYAVYFTNGGEVTLDLSDAPGSYEVTWISVAMGRILETSTRGRYGHMDKTVEGGRTVTLSAPYKGGWVAALVKQ